jgi:hypothetical protein
MHALMGLPKLYTFRIWGYTWLELLSHAFLSVVQVFHFMILSIACVLV